MMITEKAAYLKGLIDGMKINREDDTGKLLHAIVETIDEMAACVGELERESEMVSDELDLIEDAIDEIDEDIEDIYELLDDDECGCGHHHHGFDDDDDDFYEDDGESEYYELLCPTCEEKIVIDEDMLDRGSMKCPACGEELEFDFTELEEDGEGK